MVGHQLHGIGGNQPNGPLLECVAIVSVPWLFEEQRNIFDFFVVVSVRI